MLRDSSANLLVGAVLRYSSDMLVVVCRADITRDVVIARKVTVVFRGRKLKKP